MIRASPGQLYQTASGHLYHAGKICIAMVGLPGRGKTHRAVSLTRYLDWLGIKSKAFHLGNYRRQVTTDLPSESYFTEDKDSLKVKSIQLCRQDMMSFYADGGQVAVYDAINGTVAGRAEFSDYMHDLGVEVLYIECLITDGRMLARNIEDVRLTSPDYKDLDPNTALEHYLKALELRLPKYEPLSEPDMLYIKLVNHGERCVVNGGPLGYLLNRVLLFLMNSKRPQGSLFFARAGQSEVYTDKENYKDDANLSKGGNQYAKILTNTLLGHLSARRLDIPSLTDLQLQVGRYADKNISSSAGISRNSSASNLKSHGRLGSVSSASGTVDPTPTESPLVVWTSTRVKAIETSNPFQEAGFPVSHRSLLNPINPGDAGPYTDAALREKFPVEYVAHQKDPYHYRFPRAESYQDVAIRLEPLIMELERVQSNLLVVAHESILRVLYGYLMGSSVEAIPTLQFPANQIVELRSTGYSHEVTRIPLANVSVDGGIE